MRNPNHAITKACVKSILAHADAFEWSLQGLGMLRLYLEPQTRLHVWSAAAAVKEVSEVHTHPWHFRSVIVAGVLYNQRYTTHPDGVPYLRQELLCGPGGRLKGNPQPILLQAEPIERYTAGECYAQSADVRHKSTPEDGTVTIIERAPAGDPDHAEVFWRAGTEWVSAEPRPATPEEVRNITRNALCKWFQ